MNPETLLERARAMVPVLAERAQACEELRRLPDETLAEFVDAGFYRILQPARYGGYELSPAVLYEVVIELARGCPSSAWCLSIVAIHNWEVGLLDPRVAADLWTEDPDTRYSSSYAPTGRVEQVEGGYRLSGRWSFSSGCDHCSWAMLGAAGAERNGAPDPISLLVPRADYQIVDTWHVAGLKGTGSKDIVVESAFVPDYRVHHIIDSFSMNDPGRDTFSARSYAYPFGLVFGNCLASVTMGIAQAAYDLCAEQLTRRLGAFDGKPMSEDPLNTRRLADYHAQLAGNRLLFDGTFERMDAFLDRGEPIPVELRAELHWNLQSVAQSNADIVTSCFKLSGGAGLRLDNPMQRYWRDIHAACNHAFLNADRGGANFGGMQVGAENHFFML
jgi:3-hydroxy-9,10-secoandrosta-1,3,5(10)-triene-9,17-dione monooxygenase